MDENGFANDQKCKEYLDTIRKHIGQEEKSYEDSQRLIFKQLAKDSTQKEVINFTADYERSE